MKNSEFKKLENIDKINYINSELKNGKSIKAITIDLSLGKNYINQFMKRNNYKRNDELNQYIPILESINTTVVETNTNTLLTTKNADTLDYLSNNINILMDIIERYKSTTNSTTNYITIDLIDDKHLKPKPKSIRINEFVYQDWQAFCNI